MKSNAKLFVIAGLLIAVGLALFVSPFASGAPDGLNRVAKEQGFDQTGEEHALEEGPVSGYQVRGVEDERLSKALSGLIGVLITFGVGMGLFALLRVMRDRSARTVDAGTSP